MHRACVALIALFSSAAAAQMPGTVSIVSPDWLAKHLPDPKVVVLHVVHDSEEFTTGHIPGARPFPYEAFATARDGNGTELPALDKIAGVLEQLGVSDDSHVVLYSSMPGMAPMASRAFLTLDYVGLNQLSLLDGNLDRWRAGGREVTTKRTAVTPGHLTTKPRAVTVDAAWVTAHTGRPGVAFIDTRTTPEYLGSGERHGLRSEGHIAGARQLEWEQLFANADSAVFQDSTAIARLFAQRSAPGDTLVTYCLVGYRASMTYFAARMLGRPVRIYDGSYEDWARRGLPVKKGEAP